MKEGPLSTRAENVGFDFLDYVTVSGQNGYLATKSPEKTTRR